MAIGVAVGWGGGALVRDRGGGVGKLGFKLPYFHVVGDGGTYWVGAGDVCRRDGAGGGRRLNWLPVHRMTPGELADVAGDVAGDS